MFVSCNKSCFRKIMDDILMIDNILCKEICIILTIYITFSVKGNNFDNFPFLKFWIKIFLCVSNAMCNFGNFRDRWKTFSACLLLCIILTIFSPQFLRWKTFSMCPLQTKVGICWLLFFSPIPSHNEQSHHFSLPNFLKVSHLFGVFPQSHLWWSHPMMAT